MPKYREIRKRLRIARIHRPHTLVFGFVLPIPGTLAIIYGERVSSALSKIGAQGPMTLIIGLAMLFGGVFTIWGLALHKAVYEALGMCVMSVGCIVYGAGVFIGLGLGGVIAGTFGVSIALGMILRVWSLLEIASDHEKWEAYNQDSKEST